LTFFENNYQGTLSLRAYLTDSNFRYSLPVVAKALRDIYRIGGVTSLNGVLIGTGDIHVRVGLARAWSGQPGRCTVMINGMYR
jgi:hypothetical protein